MWDRRKLLLAAIAFTALYYKVTAKKKKLLDMAPDAVDDMYSGCRKEAMEKFISSGLLRQELNQSKEFQKAWELKTKFSQVIPGGLPEHTYALSTYCNGDPEFQKTFGKAVETFGTNVSTYEDHFHFKSLHFLLMDSMWLLKQEGCKTVYGLAEKPYTANKGSEVRFGRFTKVYLSYSELKKWADLGDEFIFNITSCFFANLDDNICNEENVALLSPAEVFTVEDVRYIAEDECTQIVLKHSRLNNSHNCYIFSRSPADVSTQWLVLVLVASSLFLSLTAQ